MLKHLITKKIDEIFLACQEVEGITDGNIYPHDALHLEEIERELETLINKVIAYQKEVNYDAFAPSWYIYTDDKGEIHDVVYGYADTNNFFTDVSRRIAFDDCSGETVQKIYYKGKEVEYAGWQSGMRFEYKDLDGNTVWVGIFEHWDH